MRFDANVHAPRLFFYDDTWLIGYVLLPSIEERLVIMGLSVLAPPATPEEIILRTHYDDRAEAFRRRLLGTDWEPRTQVVRRREIARAEVEDRLRLRTLFNGPLGDEDMERYFQ